MEILIHTCSNLIITYRHVLCYVHLYIVYTCIYVYIVPVCICVYTVCVCMASRRHAARKRKEEMAGMVSESSYGLMTTSFSQRSHLSSMYDNPAASNVHTPTSSHSLTFYHPLHHHVKMKRTISDPQLLTTSAEAD